MPENKNTQPAEPIKFANKDVAEKFTTTAKKDFQIRIPSLNPQWYGMFSQITTEVAEQLIKEGYNRIAKK